MSENVFPDQYACHCFEESGECICGVDERALRHYAYGAEPMPAMTPAQRSWCVSQAVQSGEGSIRAEVIMAYSDKALAGEVLRSWVMYVNSNCGFL